MLGSMGKWRKRFVAAWHELTGRHGPIVTAHARTPNPAGVLIAKSETCGRCGRLVGLYVEGMELDEDSVRAAYAQLERNVRTFHPTFEPRRGDQGVIVTQDNVEEFFGRATDALRGILGPRTMLTPSQAAILGFSREQVAWAQRRPRPDNGHLVGPWWVTQHDQLTAPYGSLSD